ncbi:MAG: hypothetical protein RLZZ437_1303 [Pseudomonadota bacterium]
MRRGKTGVTGMTIMIWAGAALAMAGVAGLIWCILMALRAKREGLTGPAMQARLQRVVVWNMAALAVSAIGLMLVVAGVILS